MGSAETQGELWGAAPDGWAMIQERQHRPLFEAMLDAAGVTEGSHVLDAGCGSGSASVIAAERGAHVSGIDAAEGLVTYARERVPDGDFHVGDIELLPFADDAFDTVIAPNSVQYSADRVATLRGFGRVCHKGALVVAGLFGAPDKVAYAAVFAAVREALPEPSAGKGPFELSMPNVLESLFEEAGLNIVETGEVNCPFAYADYEQFWAANASAGPLQGAIRAIGKDALKEALRKPVEDFQLADGSIEIGPNYFKFVVASV